MIQRIQSIFLLLASGAAFSMFGLPFGKIEDTTINTASFDVLKDHIFNLNDHIGLLILAILAGSIALINIFLFKNRKLQMHLCKLILLVNFLIVAAVGVLFYEDLKTLADVDPVNYIGLGVVAPFLAMLFTSLANRNINQDEKLVNSMDRLR